MKRFVGVLVPVLVVATLAVGGWVLVANSPIDVLQPAGQVAAEQQQLFVLTTFLSSLVVVPVFTMLLFFAVRYRAGNTKARYQPEWGENRWLEMLWWGIPILIIGFLGIVTYQTSHSLDPYKKLSGGDPQKIQVVALRWKWLFLYPEEKIATLNYIMVERDRPIHFTLAADAPMSAFWIPKLGSQIYTMNGMRSELNLVANQTGDFTGYTTNINGEGYSNMKFVVKSRQPDEIKSWRVLARQAGPVMDEATYQTLAEPESLTEQQTYRLIDADLYDRVLHKYMGHASASRNHDHGGGH
jgi:cytochrome o ubiquinol oxidase subunit 2